MKIITALGNKKINEKLKQIKNIEINNKDIFYQEAVLEILKEEKKLIICF